MWSPDRYQNLLQRQQQDYLRKHTTNIRDAVYQQRLNPDDYNYTGGSISGAVSTAGQLIGANVNPLAGQAISMLAGRPDIVASAANTLGNLVGGDKNPVGRFLTGLAANYEADEQQKGDRAVNDYVRKIVGSYITDNPNANPNKIKWRVIRNIKKGRNPYYKLYGRKRQEYINMSYVPTTRKVYVFVPFSKL